VLQSDLVRLILVLTKVMGMTTESPFPKKRIQTRLLRWFENNARDLPWRKTRDPYAIWISEIMLQQTQVSTVIPYYRKFLRLFPTVRHLARADLSKVLKTWEGLGYYSRARNLHKASRIVSNHFRGKIPDDREGLLRLPGIGKYTAGAILSIAFNKEAPILDGNVKRVLSRAFAVFGNPAKGRTEDFLWQLSESLVPKGHAGSFNQALMDLGSTICTPKDPQCLRCPVRNLCKGRVSGDPERYPFKVTQKRIPHIEALAAVVERNGNILLRQRPPRGLLGGLWEFPNWKTESHWKMERESDYKRWLKDCIKKDCGLSARGGKTVGTFRHTFSHFKLTLHVYHFQSLNKGKQGKWTRVKNLDQLAMPRIHRRIADVLSGK